jgi:hypothetical protein
VGTVVDPLRAILPQSGWLSKRGDHMSIDSIEHRIRVSIGKVLHHKHTNANPDGTVDIEHIAREHGVSEDQVREQVAWLRGQNLIGGPLEIEGQQVSQVPNETLGNHQLSDAGLAWAMAGYPLL